MYNMRTFHKLLYSHLFLVSGQSYYRILSETEWNICCRGRDLLSLGPLCCSFLIFWNERFSVAYKKIIIEFLIPLFLWLNSLNV